MTPRKKLSVVRPDDLAEYVLEQLGRREVDQLPVLEGEKLVGIIRRADIIKWLTIQDAVPEHLD